MSELAPPDQASKSLGVPYLCIPRTEQAAGDTEE